MNGEQSKNTEEKIIYESTITSNKNEQNKYKKNSEINENISFNTKSLEEKLYQFEKEINNRPIFKKISNYAVKCEKELIINNNPNNEKIKIATFKNSFDINNYDIENYYNNTEINQHSKLRDLESKWNDEDRKNNHTFSENILPQKKIKNSYYNKSYHFNQKEKLFDYSNFLEERDYLYQKERFSLQNNNNNKSRNINKNKNLNQNIKNSKIYNTIGNNYNNKINNEKVEFLISKNNDKNYKEKEINRDFNTEKNLSLSKKSNEMNNLDNKIKDTKEKFNNCLKTTFTSLIDKKNLFEEITKSEKKINIINNYKGNNMIKNIYIKIKIE
jgi:hypothetical protein